MITFRQFQHTDSLILNCFPHLKRSRAECYNPAGHTEEMGRLFEWKHTLVFFGRHKGLLAGSWIVLFQRLYEGTLLTCSLLDFTSSLWGRSAVGLSQGILELLHLSKSQSQLRQIRLYSCTLRNSPVPDTRLGKNIVLTNYGYVCEGVIHLLTCDSIMG